MKKYRVKSPKKEGLVRYNGQEDFNNIKDAKNEVRRLNTNYENGAHIVIVTWDGQGWEEENENSNFISEAKNHKGMQFTAREFKYCFGMGMKELNNFVKNGMLKLTNKNTPDKVLIYEVV